MYKLSLVHAPVVVLGVETPQIPRVTKPADRALPPIINPLGEKIAVLL
jgi:hypothetical protein